MVRLFDQGTGRWKELLLHFLSRTASRLHGGPEPWSHHVWNKRQVGQQSNGSDCGVFTLKVADYYSQNAPLDF